MSDEPSGNGEEIPEEFVLPIEQHIDLHPFRPKEIRAVVESYLEEAEAAGFREVRLIHGRGIGVQREIIRSLLSGHPRVVEFSDAPPERGGWGATLVRLKGGDGAPQRVDDSPGLEDNDRSEGD